MYNSIFTDWKLRTLKFRLTASNGIHRISVVRQQKIYDFCSQLTAMLSQTDCRKLTPFDHKLAEWLLCFVLGLFFQMQKVCLTQQRLRGWEKRSMLHWSRIQNRSTRTSLAGRNCSITTSIIFKHIAALDVKNNKDGSLHYISTQLLCK